MYSSELENSLIDVDIASLMSDRVSIQLDIDETKIKAAALVAQEIDIEEVIGTEALERVVDVDETNEADVKLKKLIINAWCYFTYYRCLIMFNGTFTDSGYVIETTAEKNDAAKSNANTIKSIGNSFLKKVVAFLEEENPNIVIDETKIVRNIRTIGGEERR